MSRRVNLHIALSVLLCFLLTGLAFGQSRKEQELVSSKITSVKLADSRAPLYILSIVQQNSSLGEETTYLRPVELEPLMKQWHLKKPEELVNHVLQAPKGYSAWNAVQFTYFALKNGAKNYPPSKEKLQQRALSAFVAGRVPTFKDTVDGQTVFQAFYEAYYDKTYLPSLEAQIATKSHGKAILRDATMQELDGFKSRTKGPATYLILQTGNKIQRLTFGPYSTPFGTD